MLLTFLVIMIIKVLVIQPEDYLYSSARDYNGEKGILNNVIVLKQLPHDVIVRQRGVECGYIIWYRQSQLNDKIVIDVPIDQNDNAIQAKVKAIGNYLMLKHYVMVILKLQTDVNSISIKAPASIRLFLYPKQ